MSIGSAVTVSTWTADGLTIKSTAAKLHGIIALGSAAASVIVILDNATPICRVAVGTTASVSVVFCSPIAIRNSLVITNTGTAAYSVQYV
jgi:hypothetical protein